MNDPGAALAERLAWLRESFPNPETGRPYEVKAIAASTGISLSQLYKILSGESPNPGWQHLKALAGFFGVPLDTFDDGEHGEKIRTQLAALVELRSLKEGGVEAVSLRGLTPAQADRIRGVVEDLRRSNTSSDHDEA
ncbi:Transcriptional regulator, contains XRE-family HTH domain [Saccharopolyspora kobensis]|uniref:Transcriptional regulator, contains XRE-family HTH domain n=1 Tax=Saccharopolyspora kobensis TaxID=146035 RepID=A0A1H6EG19_9PSEU|nr:helix-turn-helix domain-containing protein [Saccharopolyspora kobensis]SEG96712.1 Transcriptional regulator, contains XRE-family HTH domain [Saccharopolyspora kobensis]SFF04411.1 Transcriptional regulator, contains XRE-family HTH domain [Saccharopolyspora kobensis]